jgi:hypothetical protein
VVHARLVRLAGGGGGGAWPALRMDPLPWLIEEGGAGLALGGVSDGVEF